MAVRPPAALDTSFWVVGHRADVLPYVFQYFTVYVPLAVRAEILAVDAAFPRRQYAAAAWFELLEARGLLPAVSPTESLAMFGPGEAAALALAHERGWRLLINDYRPLRYAEINDIRTVSVPSFVLLLYERQTVSLTSAERKLELIAEHTSEQVMEPIGVLLDRLSRARQERQ